MTLCPHSLHLILSVVFIAVFAPQSYHQSYTLYSVFRGHTSTDVLYRFWCFRWIPPWHVVWVLLAVVVVLRHLWCWVVVLSEWLKEVLVDFAQCLSKVKGVNKIP